MWAAGACCAVMESCGWTPGRAPRTPVVVKACCGSWAIGHAWTTPVQGLTQDVIGDDRDAPPVVPELEPPALADERARPSCFLRLRGRSLLPRLDEGAVVEDETPGAMVEVAPPEPEESPAPALARSAVEAVSLAVLASQLSS
uniref:Uncharacterized protein n=1 Tax=Arundo donax TaxID=35708 RepID=A0A0A9QP68_ARUDO